MAQRRIPSESGADNKNNSRSPAISPQGGPGAGATVNHRFDYRPYGGKAGSFPVPTNQFRKPPTAVTSTFGFTSSQPPTNTTVNTLSAPNASQLIADMGAFAFFRQPSQDTNLTISLQFFWGQGVGDFGQLSSTTETITESFTLTPNQSATLSRFPGSTLKGSMYYTSGRVNAFHHLSAYAGGETPRFKARVKTPDGGLPSASFTGFGATFTMTYFDHTFSKNFLTT